MKNVLDQVKIENVRWFKMVENTNKFKELTLNKPRCSRERNIVEKH
jgi:hypothetical protein